MSEPSKLLADKLQSLSNKSGLIIADESTRIKHFSKATLESQNCRFMTNRYDMMLGLENKGVQNAIFSDFDFSQFGGDEFDFVAFRVGKEKAVVHYVINQSLRILKPKGMLILSGYRNEGIKTYVSKSTTYLGGPDQTQTKTTGARISCISKMSSSRERQPLDDKQYAKFREIEFCDKMTRITKPGIFGWNKVDSGSEYLVSNAEPVTDKSVLDLGCGYGYLALKAAGHVASEVVATDNNAAGIAACKANFDKLEITGTVVASNAASQIERKFDVIWCNPPFHQGKRIDKQIASKFARAMSLRLNRRGYALTVVNAFLPFDKVADRFFKSVVETANNGKFKVLRLSDPMCPSNLEALDT